MGIIRENGAYFIIGYAVLALAKMNIDQLNLPCFNGGFFRSKSSVNKQIKRGQLQKCRKVLPFIDWRVS